MTVTFDELFANSYVIYVPGRSDDRLTWTLSRLADVGVFANPLAGVNGRDLPDSVIEEYPAIGRPAPDVNYSENPNIVKGIIGCSLSHMSTFKFLEDHEFIAVFEDDALPAPHFREYVSKALEVVPPWDLLHFSTRHLVEPEPVNEYWVKSRYFRVATCYVLRKKAADAYVQSWNERPQIFDILQDHDVFNTIRVYCITPSMVVQQKSTSLILGLSYHVASLRDDSWLSHLSPAEYGRWVTQNSNPVFWPKNFVPDADLQ